MKTLTTEELAGWIPVGGSSNCCIVGDVELDRLQRERLGRGERAQSRGRRALRRSRSRMPAKIR